MQIPETPQHVQELDLMKRLDEYANGQGTWLEDEREIGKATQQACRTLHTELDRLVTLVFNPILERTTTREMELFTMHDPRHARKVAHLMWHILERDRRRRLTPPEIGLLVGAAYLHDLGMALSPEEREIRLAPESPLWERLQLQDSQRTVIDTLRAKSSDTDAAPADRERARRMLHQAEEALLCLDTRERHATRDRYTEVLRNLDSHHEADATTLALKGALAFDGQSFLDKLIAVCQAHHGDAEVLVRTDGTGSGRPLFPRDYPVGSCNADLHMVAAALRLADILDFDRERTPSVLFHFLLPESLGTEHRSVVEWSKHLAISNWDIGQNAIVFHGRSDSHIVHHAIVQFCDTIKEEIAATKATFGALGSGDWPFDLPMAVEADIHEEGYRYIPYRFELADERVYELFMGGAIYENPLAAVRELVQNAVDACKLLDGITRLDSPHSHPDTDHRITVQYEEPTDDCPQPRLVVRDTGTGMDAIMLERYFLKVGRSYYRSTEFNEIRFQLRKAVVDDLDFAPISEFGIGFLSSFLLADHVKVETAMWEPMHGTDISKRTLWIDGPTRLIRLEEEKNEGRGRFRGTQVTLFLSQGGRGAKPSPPTWEAVVEYLRDVCLALPYRLRLEHLRADGVLSLEHIDPSSLKVDLPPHLEPLAVRIPVADEQAGLEGEITLVSPRLGEEAERERALEAPVAILENRQNALLRGGFKVGSIPGLPGSYVASNVGRGILKLSWKSKPSRRYRSPNLARTGVVDVGGVHRDVCRLWLTHLLDHVDNLPDGMLYHLGIGGLDLLDYDWLQQYDALTIYRLARLGWRFAIKDTDKRDELLLAWEKGEGKALYLGQFRNELHCSLLDLILPKVTTLQMAPQGSFYISPPNSGWRPQLKGWRDFITAPVEWGPFVEYIGNIAHLVAYEYPGVTQLNERFRSKINTVFSNDELTPLRKILVKLVNSRSYFTRQAVLNDRESMLFQRALDTIGDLEIGSIHGTWRIDAFAPLGVARS